MTCAERLRKYLYENGYSICQEEIVVEHGKMYTIMLCIYSGKIVLPDIKMMYIGKSQNSNEYALEYLEKQYNRLISISEGIKKSAKHEDCLLYTSIHRIAMSFPVMNNYRQIQLFS